jgi:S-adenosylmethionine:tRNA ribosyltransferase-isomerase
MVLNCAKSSIDHKRFYDLPSLLKPGDLLILNDTKVFRARLTARKLKNCSHAELVSASQSLEILKQACPEEILKQVQDDEWVQDDEREFEVFLLRPEGDAWLAMVKGLKKIQINDELIFEEGVKAKLINKLDDGSVLLRFDLKDEEVFSFTDRHGQVPTPPYVKQSDRLDDYQTVYAQKTGSAAAPTAGFHFTPELIDKLKSQGIKFATVTLHVGLGTFKPITAEKLEEHVMHEEWVEVPQATLDAIAETKRRGGRVIAVGTTSVRSLESGVQNGFTDIFIKPGYQFKVVDAMITNFHLPASTLIVLVSAFAQNKSVLSGQCSVGSGDEGRQFILQAYDEAIKNNYRFYSFGDAMFIE